MTDTPAASAALAKPAEATVAPATVFSSYKAFREGFEMARYLSASSLVPQQYQGQQHTGDCLIALELAQRVGASPLGVMQSMTPIHGRPAWSSAFLIGSLNVTGRFSPLRYKMTGKRGTDTWGCIACAVDRADGTRLEGPEVTIAMAKAEGWVARNGSKWQTMPEMMLHYRAASFFVRLYAPEVSLGMRSVEEAEDIGPAQPINITNAAKDLLATEGPENRAESAPEAATPATTRSRRAKPADAQSEASTSDDGLAALCHAHGVTLEDVRHFFGRIGQAWDESVVRANIERIAADMRQMQQEDDAL